MIASILVILCAFVWLGFETKWLTIRLPYGRNIIARLIETMIAIVIGVSLIPPDTDGSRQKWYLRYRLFRLLRRQLAMENK